MSGIADLSQIENEAEDLSGEYNINISLQLPGGVTTGDIVTAVVRLTKAE